MINTISKLSLSVVVAVCLAACGGGEKKTETPATTDTTKPATDTTKPDTATPPTAPAMANAGEPTCEAAVKHGMGLVVKAGMATQAQMDAKMAESIEKCKKENPTKEMLNCVLQAKAVGDLAGCDKQHGKKDAPKSSPTSGPEEGDKPATK